MTAHFENRITDNLDLLFATLPSAIQRALRAHESYADLLEIVMDLGRLPEARFLHGTTSITADPVTENDIQYVIQRVGEFGDDNRAGIERTLHRISAIRNRQGKVIGLTCRVGRAVFGAVELVRDVVEQGSSLLILGRPGVGKTTILREIARVLADDLGKRVVIVDTSNEIAGDGDVPHPGIGRARRLQVAHPSEQHAVMIEAVENHMPEVIIIDEIGTELEAQAARTIAERGVQLIGTAHGNTLDNLLLNPTLSDLIGGISSVTLGDEEARRRGTQKTVLERKAPPTFDVVVEQQDRWRVLIHDNVAEAVDAMLRGEMPARSIREMRGDGHIAVSHESARPATLEELRGPLGKNIAQNPRAEMRTPNPRSAYTFNRRQVTVRSEERTEKPLRMPIAADAVADTSQRRQVIYPLGISRSRLEEVIQDLRVPAVIGYDEHEADTILALKSIYRKQPDRIESAQESGKAVYILRTGAPDRLREVIIDLFGVRER